MEESEMEKQKFTGDKKLPMTTLLAPYEKRFINANVKRFPKWIEGYHLTLLTIPWSLCIIGAGFMAGHTGNRHWLWVSSVMLLLQWFTDCFDGALGRARDTGIPKWGFYMDHFLDYVFLCAIFLGYSFMLEKLVHKQVLYFMMPVFGCYMVSSFLSFGATGEFKITYLGTGPTEIRIWFIVLNTVLIFFGTGWVEPLLVYVLAISILMLCFIVWRTSSYIWSIDMADKKARLEKTEDHQRE